MFSNIADRLSHRVANSAKNIDIFFEIGVLMWTLHPVHLPVLQRFAGTYDGCVSESGYGSCKSNACCA